MVLRNGSIKIRISSSQGRALILGIARPGEALGLHSVLRGAPSATSAESLEPCEVIFYPREPFLKFLDEHVEAWFMVAQQLANSYETACGALRRLWFAGSAPGKLAQLLLERIGHSREAGPNAPTVPNLISCLSRKWRVLSLG